MSEISTRIRKYLNNPEVNDPEVTKHYGRWCAFNRDQRRQIRELCNTCDMFEKTADSFWIEIERLKAEIERLTKALDEQYESCIIAMDIYKAEAVKEFAERLIKRAYVPKPYGYGKVVDALEIAHLAEEFTEGKDEDK